MAIADPASVRPSGERARPREESERSLARTLEFVETHAHWVLAALILADLALLLHMGRGLTFYYDEWDFVQKDYGGGWHILVAPHVGNIVFFPAIAYKILFHLAGLNHYAVYRLAVIVLHLISCGLVYVLAARRTSRAGALLATTLVLFMGMAWEDLLWPFQIGYLLSIASGLGAWLLIERGDRRGDALATLCLVLSVGSSSLGIAVGAGIFVELAWQRDWRRLWVVAVPAALYALWYLSYGESEVTAESLIHAPGYAADLAAAATGAIVGRGLEWGRPLALVAALLLLVRFTRPLPVSPRLAGMIAAALVLWGITAAARSTISPPETSRYVYLGAVTIVLIGVEVMHGITISPRAVVIAAVLVVYSAAAGLTTLHSGSQNLRGISATLTAELGALELAAAHAPPNYHPDPIRAPTLEAGSYLHTVRSIGSSPADSPHAIAASDPESREAADKVLVALYAPVLRPLRSAPSALAPAPALLTVSGGAALQRGACVHVTAAGAVPATAAFTLPAGAAVIRNEGTRPAALALRRYGEAFITLPAAAPARSVSLLALPADKGVAPWQLQESSATAVSLCGYSP